MTVQRWTASDHAEPDPDPVSDDRVDKTRELAQRFFRAVLDDPTPLDEIPEGANAIFLPADDPVTAEANAVAGERMRRAGKLVHFARV